MDVMSKKFRGKVNNSSSSCSRSCGNMAAESSDDNLRWPSIAGPTVPENNPKLWKTPRLDMSSSLSFLRRELVSIILKVTSFEMIIKLNPVKRLHEKNSDRRVNTFLKLCPA